MTSEKVDHLLTPQMRSDLDRLLEEDIGLGMTRLAWLTRPATEATAGGGSRGREAGIPARESRAKAKSDEALIERAKAGETRQLLLQVVLPVLADPLLLSARWNEDLVADCWAGLLRIPPRAAPRPALRPAGRHLPARPDRAGLVPHPAHQRRRHLDQIQCSDVFDGRFSSAGGR